MRTTLRPDHPTACFFLDESGAIAKDRFFSVGLLKLREPSSVLTAVQRYRDRTHFYDEFHFTEVRPDSLSVYKGVIDELATSDDLEFWCFVSDRDVADPVQRWQTHWMAYEKMAEQLMVAASRPYELASAVADTYSTPDHVSFERDVRKRVNQRFDRCAIASLYRSDSKAMDGLQVVDLLTGAVTFEFRQAAGLAGRNSPKAQLARHVRESFEIAGHSFTDLPCKSDRVSVRLYEHGKWKSPVSTSG